MYSLLIIDRCGTTRIDGLDLGSARQGAIDLFESDPDSALSIIRESDFETVWCYQPLPTFRTMKNVKPAASAA